MKRIFMISIVFALFVSLTACGAKEQPPEAGSPPLEGSESSQPNETKTNAPQETEAQNDEETEDITDMKMNVQIGDASFTATLEDNAAVREFVGMMKEAPVSVSMSDYSGFEKVGALGRSLTADDRQTTTSVGDIVLYSGDQIVMFYGSNSWSYTRIGRIDDLTGWEEALGSGSITAVFAIQ